MEDSPTVKTQSGEKRPGSSGSVRTCPRCNTTFSVETPATGCMPFCSSFCKMQDLAGWFRQEYIISTPLSHSNDEEAPAIHDESISEDLNLP
jgi:endogenous inhibitor of DNA gyrase (YacG/DUF329 family)